MSEADIPTVDILEAALEAFAEHGYAATSVREIARSLGGSHNLIPNRFGTKEQLWYAAVDYGGVQQRASLSSTLAEPLDSDFERLQALVGRLTEATMEHPALLRIVAREATTSGPRLDYLFDNWIEPVREFGAELLSNLSRSGEVAIDSVGLVYFFMAFGGGGPAAFPALAERFGIDVDGRDRDAVRRHRAAAVTLLFHGLLARPPQQGPS